ncbi:protein HEXIM [Silurus meridionalis]|nr:protein HEXIM [Silurus meridionalis]
METDDETRGGSRDYVGRLSNQEFLQQGFLETYEEYYLKRIHNTSKQKRIQECLELERYKSHLEEEKDD